MPLFNLDDMSSFQVITPRAKAVTRMNLLFNDVGPESGPMRYDISLS